MPEHCPICDTELIQGRYCPQCKRDMTPECQQREIEMLRGAIEGWRRENTRLKAELAKGAKA